MTPSWRKPAGVIAILVLILVYGVIVATLADSAMDWPMPAQLLFFCVAGIAWIFPVRPLLTWMETGKIR